MKIAILTREHYKSPRILAETLQCQLEQEAVQVDIFYEINLLNRLVSFKQSKLSLHFWLLKKLSNFFKDRKVLKKLKGYDAIMISECTPNGFRKQLYNVEKLKLILNKPVLYYEVYFLGNAPTQIELLRNNNDALMERYDMHLCVSEVTEIRQEADHTWFPIGLYAKSWGLTPKPKKELIAIVDFVQEGYEVYREVQLNALKKAGIKFISLERRYTIEEIREIYQEAAIFFVQFPEAFGLPILECLCCGDQIFTPGSGWPMAWRLDADPSIHGDGTLPGCFTIYNNEDELVEKLIDFKNKYDLINTPKNIFKVFLDNYSSYYYGNKKVITDFLTKIKDYK